MDRWEWVVPYLVIVALAIAGAYVVTPYDDLSYLLLTAAVIVGLRRRPWSWPVPRSSVVGTATRESFLVGVAAMFAAVLARPSGVRGLGRAIIGKDDRLAASAVAMAVGSLVTYVVLRIVMAGPPDASTRRRSGRPSRCG